MGTTTIQGWGRKDVYVGGTNFGNVIVQKRVNIKLTEYEGSIYKG